MRYFTWRLELVSNFSISYLYLTNDTLLLADIFEHSAKVWLEIYELHPAKILLFNRLVLQVASKKAKVKVELLSDIDWYEFLTDMSLMMKKGIRGRLYQFINIYAKDNNKYIKDYDIGHK